MGLERCAWKSEDSAPSLRRLVFRSDFTSYLTAGPLDCSKLNLLEFLLTFRSNTAVAAAVHSVAVCLC